MHSTTLEKFCCAANQEFVATRNSRIVQNVAVLLRNTSAEVREILDAG